MAKKALIDLDRDCNNEYGAPSDAVRVAQVVDEADVFEVGGINVEWKDCPDEVEADRYWYSPSAGTYTKFPLDIKSITYEGTTVTVTVNESDDTEVTPSCLTGKVDSVTMSGQVPSDFSGTFEVSNTLSTTKFQYELNSEPSGECTTLGTVVKV